MNCCIRKSKEVQSTNSNEESVDPEMCVNSYMELWICAEVMTPHEVN